MRCMVSLPGPSGSLGLSAAATAVTAIEHQTKSSVNFIFLLSTQLLAGSVRIAGTKMLQHDQILGVALVGNHRAFAGSICRNKEFVLRHLTEADKTWCF